MVRVRVRHHARGDQGRPAEVVPGGAGHHDVTFSRSFVGSHLENGPKKGATGIIWNTIYYSLHCVTSLVLKRNFQTLFLNMQQCCNIHVDTQWYKGMEVW